jgi:hypothetical protein
MNRYTQGARAKRKLSGEEAYSQASTGAGKKKKPSSVGAYSQGAGKKTLSAGEAAYSQANTGAKNLSGSIQPVDATNDYNNKVLAKEQQAARIQPELIGRAESGWSGLPRLPASGRLELIGPKGELPRLGADFMPSTDLGRGGRSGPTDQEIDAMAKQLGITPLQIRAMWGQGGTSNLTGGGGATLQAQSFAGGRPLQQQALEEAAEQARGAGQQQGGELDWQRDKRLAEEAAAGQQQGGELGWQREKRLGQQQGGELDWQRDKRLAEEAAAGQQQGGEMQWQKDKRLAEEAAKQQMPGEMGWQRDKRLGQQEVADGAYDPTVQQSEMGWQRDKRLGQQGGELDWQRDKRLSDQALTESQQSIAATSQLSPLEQEQIQDREEVKPPEERIDLDAFAKSADLVGGLSSSDQAEATRILKEEGQAAFATFVSSRSVVSEAGGLKIDAVTLGSLNDAKTAFAQGGFEDFFKAHDQFQVLSNPNASEEEKSAAAAAMEDVLANPNPDANARIVKTDNFQTGNDALDKALAIVAGAGTSGTIDEADLEGLDEETQAVVRNVANKVKLRADAAGQNFDEAKKRALAKERTGDLGNGMSGNIARPPDNWSNEKKAGHWLNQMLSAARSGEFSNSWKDTLLYAFHDVGLSSDSAWAKIVAAFKNYTADKNTAVSDASVDVNNSISITEDDSGGDTLDSFIKKRREELEVESEAEDAEIAKNTDVLKSLDTLLAGGQVSEEALAALPPEMTDRVRNIQVQSREYEIARRESSLLQQFDQFEEGERQRISANTERDRLKGKAPSLTLDVAGGPQPESTVERVASVEGKIDRGGQLTGQDMIGLPADEQRRLQDRSTTAINRMTDVDEANAEIQLEARRRMLDPFTAAGGASIYGQGNAHQTFGRNVMSGVEQRIAQTLNDITVSADRERAGRKSGINHQYDQAIHKLSRIFATSPDKLSGAAQRRFEELESERANALSGVDMEVDRSVRDEQRTNIELLTGLQESREAAALGAEELNLNALGQAAGFAGGLDDRALREAEVYGRDGERETLSGEIQRGQLGLGERETSLREAEMFGGTEGVNLGQLTSDPTLPPRLLGMDGKLVPGISNDQFFLAQSEIESGFRERFGRDPSEAEMMRLMQGQAIGGRTTLEAELGRGGLEETETERAERQKLDRDRFGLEQEIERGRLSETVDARTGAQELDTSAQELDRQRLGLEQEIGLGRLGLERAELFGGADSITLGQIGDFGFDTLLNPDGSVVTGVDQGAFMEASSRIEEGFNQRYGRSPSASEMTRIMQGEEVGGRSTLAASEAQSDRRLQAETATGTITIDGKRQQTLQDYIERGELTNETSALFADQLGYIRDPVDGSKVQTLSGKAHELQDDQFSESTRQFNAEFFGNMIDPETGKVREGLDSAQVATQITQFNRQMANTERELTANIGQTWASITGETGTPSPVNADDFGVDISAMKDVNPMMWRNTQEYKRVADGIQSMTGQAATDDQVMNILSGQDAMIDGAPTMEARELSTRVVQANMDRAVQVSQFAKEIGLSRDQFEQAEEAADREWQVVTQDIAGIFGVSEQKWAEARNKYERDLSAGIKPEEAARAAARHAQMDFADFQSANNMFEERWGMKSRAAAIELGMTEEQWNQTKDAQKRMMDKENQYWDGIMQGVGVNVTLDSVMSSIDITDIPVPDGVAKYLDSVIDEVFKPFQERNSRGENWTTAEKVALKNGITDMYVRDPEGAMRTLWEISEKDSLSDSELAQYEEQGVPAAVAQMYVNTGVNARVNLGHLNDYLRDTLEYTGPTQGPVTDDQIRTVLENEYEMRDMTDEQWRQTIRDVREGTQVKVPPKDWINNVQPPELRMELLSLLHGGTSFAIASKEPSVMDAVGGFAGQIIGTGLGTWASAGFPGISDPGLKQNVVHIGRSSSGLNVYEFDYKPGLGLTGRYRGVMSNEIPQNAVIHRAIHGRYDAVDYSKIDVDFERLR